jgi:hypothetical protein
MTDGPVRASATFSELTPEESFGMMQQWAPGPSELWAEGSGAMKELCERLRVHLAEPHAWSSENRVRLSHLRWSIAHDDHDDTGFVLRQGDLASARRVWSRLETTHTDLVIWGQSRGPQDTDMMRAELEVDSPGAAEVWLDTGDSFVGFVRGVRFAGLSRLMDYAAQDNAMGILFLPDGPTDVWQAARMATMRRCDFLHKALEVAGDHRPIFNLVGVFDDEAMMLLRIERGREGAEGNASR